MTDAVSILIQIVAKTLIGDVKERKQATRAYDVTKLPPFRGSEIGSGRIVATPMQKNHVTRRSIP